MTWQGIPKRLHMCSNCESAFESTKFGSHNKTARLSWINMRHANSCCRTFVAGASELSMIFSSLNSSLSGVSSTKTNGRGVYRWDQGHGSPNEGQVRSLKGNFIENNYTWLLQYFAKSAVKNYFAIYTFYNFEHGKVLHDISWQDLNNTLIHLSVE